MGNTNTKDDKQDEVYLNGLSRGMDVLRKSIDSYPDGTKKYRSVLDSHERKVEDILRRSRKGSTRQRALGLQRDLEDLKEKERASIRDSSLDHGAVESNSIIAADAKKYDKTRQLGRSVEDLQNIRKKVDHLGSKISGAGTPKEAAATRAELAALKNQLDRVSVRPNSKLEAYRDEYKNRLRRYEQKLASKEQSLMTDGSSLSKSQPLQQQRQQQFQRQHQQRRSEEHPQQQQQQSQEQSQQQQQQQQQQKAMQKHLNQQNELAMIQGQVLSLQDECEKFEGFKDTPEYNALSQNLMRLWDNLGKITDSRLMDERDSIIGLIASTLKQLNRKCMENTRGSLSNNKILSLAELFHMQYKKISVQVKQGRVKESEQIYCILRDVYVGLGSILERNENECQLVTARLTPSAKRRPVTIYVSNQQLMETNYDTVYVQDEGNPKVLKSNKSCPNLRIHDQQAHHVHATYVPQVEKLLQNGSAAKPLEQPAQDVNDQDIAVLNDESNVLKYAVENYNGTDLEKYNELDERLIELIIQGGNLKGKINDEQEERLEIVMQRVKATCSHLKQKYQDSQPSNNGYVRTSKDMQNMQDVEATLAQLEILRTQINESYEWQTDSPEFKVLHDALKSAMARLDLIEPGNDWIVKSAKEDAINEVRQSIKRLNERGYVENHYAGTAV